ncbi:MAG: hypothetical protein AAB947_00900 [Patescibacteria group bacterium]
MSGLEPRLVSRKSFEPQNAIKPNDTDFFEKLSDQDKDLIPKFLQEILNINEDKVTTLKTDIQKQNGMLRIFVHPLYLHGENVTKRRKDSAKIVEKGFERHINSKSRIPLIVLEETPKTDALRQKKLLAIPTQKDNPSLDAVLSKSIMHNFSFYPRYVEQITKERDEVLKLLDTMIYPGVNERKAFVSSDEYIDYKMADALKDVTRKLLFTGLSVKRIIIGGMYLDNDGKHIDGCVAPVIRCAKELGIQVVLSRYHMDLDGRDVNGKFLV